jgi:hypothetical protein
VLTRIQGCWRRLLWLTEEGIDREHELREGLGSDRLAPLQSAYVLIAIRGRLAMYLQTLHRYI